MLLDNGQYDATVTGIKEDRYKEAKFGDGSNYIVFFNVGTGNGGTVERRMYYPRNADGSVGDRSNFGIFVKTLMGDVPQEFDTEDLKGLPCIVDVERQKRAKGEFDNIVAVHPAAKY